MLWVQLGIQSSRPFDRLMILSWLLTELVVEVSNFDTCYIRGWKKWDPPKTSSCEGVFRCFHSYIPNSTKGAYDSCLRLW